MSDLCVRANRPASGQEPLVRVTPAEAGWTYIGFSVHRLSAGDRLTLARNEGRETAVIVLEGSCDVTVEPATFANVGGRDSVFDARPPEAVYVPPGHTIELRAQTVAEVAVATAETTHGSGAPRCIRQEDIPFERRGDGSTERFIHHILDEHHPANKLLLVEVVTPPGHWSSYPPHKHDEEIPSRESYLEETYYYRIQPNHGQAMQRVYDKGQLNAVLTPSDGDVVLVPRGYHPVASPPGFKTYYLNVMAGHQRVWKYTVDSDYAFLAPSGDITGETANEKGRQA